MQTKNRTKARLILGICLAATVLLLLIGYSVQTPQVKRQEFPFSITYSYQGATETISGVYVAEYIPSAKYIDDHQIAWSGYIQDRSRLESDYYKIAEADGRSFSINLNIKPGYLMGDPQYAGSVCRPEAVCRGTSESELPVILRRMGRKKAGLWSQFAGPVVFALMILLDAI